MDVDVIPLVHKVMTEFWAHGGKFSPYQLEPKVAALRKAGQNILEAEAFAGNAKYSQWDETPAWLKPIGDAAFFAGVNRLVLHRFVQQPWNDRYKPGATMGRWGTHFDRTQTWWEPGKALVTYWQRCQALLQWGRAPAADTVGVTNASGDIMVKSVHRQAGSTDVYFVANIARQPGAATCTFQVSGMQPELWDPVTGTMRTLTHFADQNETTTLSLQFAEAQSMFIVFRQKATGKAVARVPPNGSVPAEIAVLNRAWRVTFDSAWGGPASAVTFATLTDWANRLIGDEQEPDDCEWIPGHEEKDAGSLKAFPAWFINNQPRPQEWYKQVPDSLATYVAGQLALDTAVLTRYGEREATRSEHLHTILLYLKRRRWQPLIDIVPLERWLLERALEHDNERVLLEMACE